MNWNEDTLPPPPQKSNLGVFLAGAALLLGAYLGFSVYRSKQPLPPPPNFGVTHPAVGVPLTDLQFDPLLHAKNGVSSAEFKGKTVLINLWGTWCPRCVEEFPHLVTLQQDFAAERDFQFVSVAVGSRGADPREDRNAIDKFVHDQGAHFPVYFDPDNDSHKHLMQVAKIPPDGFGYPATILLDGEGIIRGLWMGYYPGMERHLAETIRKTLPTKQL